MIKRVYSLFNDFGLVKGQAGGPLILIMIMMMTAPVARRGAFLDRRLVVRFAAQVVLAVSMTVSMPEGENRHRLEFVVIPHD